MTAGTRGAGKGGEKASLSRRRLLGAGALLGLPATAATAEVIRGADPWDGRSEAPTRADTGGRYVFFTSAEGAFVEAACARMIPNDDLGPGAVEAGVPEFIDRQLAGDFGKATRWYMQGPWGQGTDSQGYQTRQTPATLYRAAIKAIDDATGRDHNGKAFADLTGDDQDAFLKRLESGDAKLNGVDAKTFFDVFHQNVMEGFWSDPLYGGNRDMAGWKLIGYPGARYDRRDWALRHNQRYDLPPVAIAGRPAWTKRG